MATTALGVSGRIALFNDTGLESHVGCRGVSLAHDQMLERLGLVIGYRSFLGEWTELWRGNRQKSLEAFFESSLPEKLQTVEAVVVNGEGTIHHGAGLHLLAVLAGAQALGLPTFLVNAVFQECEEDLETLRNLNDFTVRDAYSSTYLRKLGLPHRVVLDSIIEASFARRPVHDFSGKVVVTDWHPQRRNDVGALLEEFRAEFGSDAAYYPLDHPDRRRDWRHVVADFSTARVVITGRHHGVCLAALAGVPFVPLSSNTWKVEGMLNLLPGGLRICANTRDLRSMCKDAVRNRDRFVELQCFLHEQRPLATFENLGSCCRIHSPSTQERAIVPQIAAIEQLQVNPISDRDAVEETAFPLNLEVPFSSAEIDVWLDEHLTISGVGKTLVVGPGASEITAKLLERGVDAWGIDTVVTAPRSDQSGRCRAGSLDDIPWISAPFSSVLVLGSLDTLSSEAIHQTVKRFEEAITGTVHVRIFSAREILRDRTWWEREFFRAGFRKHPLRHQVLASPYPNGSQPLVMYFERISSDGECFDANSGNEGVLSIDPSRISGDASDTVLALYALCVPLVRPWDTVLDLACGSGAGTHLLQRATRAHRFIAIETDATVISYAHAHFPAKTCEFRCEDLVDALVQLPDHSIDFAVCASPLNEVGALDGLLEVMERLLAPGGRLVFAIETNSPQLPIAALRSRVEQGFILEATFRAATDEDVAARRYFQPVELIESQVGNFAALSAFVVMRDPLAEPTCPYRETAFRHVADGTHSSVLRYEDYYANPWILHSLVHGGFRITSQSMLAATLERVLHSSPPESADAGAALCILLYRAIAGVLTPGKKVDELVTKAQRFLAINHPNAHQLRWQVSLAFALGQMHLRTGRHDEAIGFFAAVAELDVFQWGPSLATKKSEALFLAGWLAWCAEDMESCRRWWTKGVNFGRDLLSRSLDETLLNAEFPNLSCAGDGMRELVYALENVGRCGHGLHALQLRERGISCSWDQIFGSFRSESERSNRMLGAFHARAARDRAETLPGSPTVIAGSGFHSPEGNFQWMSERGVLLCSAREFSQVHFDLECSQSDYYSSWPLRVDINLGDVRIQEAAFSRSQQIRSVQLAISPGKNEIRLRSSASFVPAERSAGSDQRQLSVRILNLRIQRTPSVQERQLAEQMEPSQAGQGA